MKLDRRYRELILAECNKHGIKPQFFGGRKHNWAAWTDGQGRTRKLYFAATPSDSRGELNARATLRRMLGETP